MKRIFSPDVLLLVVVLVIFGVLSYRIADNRPPTPEGNNPRRTTYSAKPGGWKALFLLLKQRGAKAGRWEKAPNEWPKEGVMVCGTDFSGMGNTFGNAWNDKEAAEAERWVRNGGTLFILTEEESDLTKQFRLTPDEHLKKDAVLPPQQPTPFLTGVKNIKFAGNARWLKSPASAVTVFGDLKPSVVALSSGDGNVIAISSDTLADNKHLAQGDNARFLAQAIAFYAGKNGRVWFDEYHQGYREGNTLWSALGQPGQLAAYQLLVLCVLMAYSAGRRFGLPRPLAAASRVSSEYVSSLADLYRRARAGDAALEGVYLSFWRDLCRAVALPLDSDATEVARHAAAALGEGGDRGELLGRLNRILNECEAKIGLGNAVTDEDLLRLSRDLDAMRKELDLGGND